ncbi:MAG TPA: formylglycine-generating enzyme family protein, partial [Pirellulales bacterium]|nr:formylglycine-generating enzyme family protein [Pirellulales bacterium]
VLVDACRRNARRDGVRGPGDDPKELATALAQLEPPPGLLLLHSCSEGEQAQEDGDLKHGVFMHFVLEGLRGAADADDNRHVSLRELSDYAADATELHVMNKFNGSQQPFLKCGLKASGQKYDLFALAGASPSRPVTPPDTKPKPGDSITNKLGMKLVLVPAGEFTMGSDESMGELEQAFGKLPDKFSNADEHPEHPVRITKPFYMDVYEVTKAHFAKFVEAEDYKTDAEKDGKGGWGYSEKEKTFEQKPEYTWRSCGFDQAGDHPVVNVSWSDATAFCKWLSKQEGKEFRLPTEAEWEYACRAGTTTRFYNGDDPEGLAKIGNVADGTAKEKFNWMFVVKGKDGYAFTAPAGRFRVNKFGLYDMTGNAWEWCSDWYDADYYGKSPPDDPQGPAAGSFRVVRGGGWSSDPVGCRSALRYFVGPALRNYYIGFRVVRAR